MASERLRVSLWLVVVAALVVVRLAGAVVHFKQFLGARDLAQNPPIVGQNCDAATVDNGRVYDPNQSESCLWRAYTTCKTASLVLYLSSVDTGQTHVISVQRKNGACTVTDTRQTRAPGSVGAVTTSACAGIQQQNGGLLITACGANRDLPLLPRPAQQIGHVCGYLAVDYGQSSELIAVGPAFGTGDIATAENCFWNAYTHCAAPTTLVVDLTPGYGVTPTTNATSYGEHTLVVQPSEGACALTDAYKGTVVTPQTPSVPMPIPCASLTHQADGGLIAHACGKYHDVAAPPAKAPPA